MTKLKGATLQELAITLASSKQLTNKELCDVKGGCTSCEDTRRPPRVNGNFLGNFNWNW